mgnify:CR=1 FL=1
MCIKKYVEKIENWSHHPHRPDWAYEFSDQKEPDTQICRTGPAGLDCIRTYVFKHF